MQAARKLTHPIAISMDQPARRELSSLVRALARGSLSTDEFAERALELADCSKDPTVGAIAAELVAECPIWSRRFRGRHRLPPEARRGLARCVLFLRSSLHYSSTPDELDPPCGSWTKLDTTLLVATAVLLSASIVALPLSVTLSGALLVLGVGAWWWSGRIGGNVPSDGTLCIDSWPFASQADLERVARTPKDTA